MNSPPQEYAILQDGVNHERFVSFAQKQGLTRHHLNPIERDNFYFEDVWTTPDLKTAIHYVDDPRYEVRFLWIRGEKLRELLHEASKYLAFYGDEELLENTARVITVGDGMRAIYRVGVNFPKYHPEAYQVFAAYLQHAHPGMRTAALKAIAYHLWPETEPLLAGIVDADGDPEVRDYAREMLESLCEKYGLRTAPRA